MKYKKTLDDLRAVAVNWWPKSLEAQVAAESVIPKLLETQDKFISILKISGERYDQVFDVLAASSLSANLFLKHLAVLTDFGGEPLKRLGSEFESIFPLKKESKIRHLIFSFGGKEHRYPFEALPVNGLSNSKLGIDGESIMQARGLDGLTRDVVMILLHGATSNSAHLAGLDRCDLGGLLGNDLALETYVKQKYIYVSRITTGATANGLGQIAQIRVSEFLRAELDKGYSVRSNGKVQLRGYDSTDGMPFDVVIERNGKIVGVEVSFQVTSNSVIERKAAQAENRRNLMGSEGHFIAYVLDGAGNFSRTAALTALCQSSDCTVAFSDAELLVLVDFVRGKLDDKVR
jgi:hypothetical protein